MKTPATNLTTATTPMKETEHFVDTFLLPGYEVSQIGRVRNKATGRILNSKMENGKLLVNLSVPVDFLVAYAFEPNLDPDATPFVRHKDGVDTNNFYLNLEFSAENPGGAGQVPIPLLGRKEHQGGTLNEMITTQTEQALLREVGEWVKEMTTGSRIVEASGEFTLHITYPHGPAVGISLPGDQAELLKRHVSFPATKKGLQDLEKKLRIAKLNALKS